MSLYMSKAERETFLADAHIGVLSISDGDRGPLSTPIWYLYEPGGNLRVSFGPNSRKAKLVSGGTRVSLVVQTETAPWEGKTRSCRSYEASSDSDHGGWSFLLPRRGTGRLTSGREQVGCVS